MKKIKLTKLEIVSLILVLITIGVIFIYLQLEKEKPSYSINLFYMDTYINVKIYEDNKKILKEIEDLYEKYHKLTDRYNPYEGITNVHFLNNELPINTTVKIEKELYDLIVISKNYYTKTEGNINIALGNPINIWKQYRDKVKEGIPSLTDLKSSGSTNINDIVLQDNSYLKTSDVQIDLGVIAKGYVTQKAADLLRSNNINEFIINAGGNVIVGDHYNKKKYKIGVENPLDKDKELKVVLTTNKAVVTSGGYERYYTYNNVKYHHIIDPNTLYPPVNELVSVTVITNDSTYADVMSTYLFIIGYEEGLNYIKNKDLDVMWYMFDGTIKYSDGAKAYVKK